MLLSDSCFFIKRENMLDIITYYWPRLILGLMFAVTNAFIVSAREKKKRLFAPYLIVLLIISAPVADIVKEVIGDRVYQSFIYPLTLGLNDDVQVGVYVITVLVFSAIAYILPVYLLSKIIREEAVVAATAYFMYVLVDKLCIVMATSAVSYFVIMILVVVVSSLVARTGIKEVIDRADIIEWRPVFHYQLGLFFLLETLYMAYYVFPGIVNGTFDLRNMWINSIAVVSYGFFLAFAGLNLRATREQAEKIRYMQELQEGERDIIQKFAEISEAKSGETGQHVRRVAEYSALLAGEMGLTDDDVNHIRVASMMHDVGKLLIPREIIEKPGSLNDEEWKIMQQHTTYGDEILANSKGEVIAMAREIAGQHHERWDGTGYPNCIRGDEISLFAQIVSVADVYDALTSKRAYKEPWDRERARAEIVSQRGRQFSPAIVDVFEKSFEKISAIQDTYKD